MKFPVTRECLQAFDYIKEREELKDEEIQKILDQLCKEFKQGMFSNSKEKKFVWRNLRSISAYLPRFIEKLKEVFIGCDIIVDPLKTYLIIYWS